MKFWRNAAALLTVFHPQTTHCGNHSIPKDVKNEGRPGYVDENKWTMDKMPERISGICARLRPFLQKTGVSSSPNNSKVHAEEGRRLRPSCCGHSPRAYVEDNVRCEPPAKALAPGLVDRG